MKIKNKFADNLSMDLLLWKISTGFPPHGQPLNCHAGPCANTATTRSSL
jgi:hypothetical protein